MKDAGVSRIWSTHCATVTDALLRHACVNPMPEVCDQSWRSVAVPFWPVQSGRYIDTGSSRSTRPSSTSVMKAAAEYHFDEDAMNAAVASLKPPKCCL